MENGEYFFPARQCTNPYKFENMSFYRRKWNNSAFVGLDLNPIEHLRDELECRIWARVQTCQEYGTPDKSRNKGSWLSQSFGHSIILNWIFFVNNFTKKFYLFIYLFYSKEWYRNDMDDEYNDPYFSFGTRPPPVNTERDGVVPTILSCCLETHYRVKD
ncbi:unnamed protein product [Rhizophagus irregularis]|nr:unnamed protein product [Rhizophagus irregularis]